MRLVTILAVLVMAASVGHADIVRPPSFTQQKNVSKTTRERIRTLASRGRGFDFEGRRWELRNAKVNVGGTTFTMTNEQAWTDVGPSAAKRVAAKAANKPESKPSIWKRLLGR